MPRNGSGVYSLPQPPFVPNTVISSSAVNSDFSDIATALTGSVARDGQSPMTGQLLAIDGTVGAPGIAFAADPNTGIRRVGADEMALVAAGADALTISPTAATFASGINVGITGNLTITGAETINGALTINGAAASLFTIDGTDAGAASGPFFIVRRTSASPAANDFIGGFFLQGKDSGQNNTNYVSFTGQILDPTDGSEDGRGIFQVLTAGAFANVITYGPGVQIGAPAGGDMGAGTINATGYFINGVAAVSKLAQVVRSTNVTYTTLGTILPQDDTIPQITEGDEVLTAAITPTNAASTLEIEVTLNVGSDQTAGIVSAALFVDATANALAAACTFVQNTAAMTVLVLKFSVTAASLTARTYRVRAGSSVATDAYLNGDGTTRLFGGVAISSITVTEILP